MEFLSANRTHATAPKGKNDLAVKGFNEIILPFWKCKLPPFILTQWLQYFLQVCASEYSELYPYLYICSCLVTQSIEALWCSITNREKAFARWDVSDGSLFINNWSCDYDTKDGVQMQVVFLIYLLNLLIYEALYTTKMDVNCPDTHAFSWSLFSLVNNRRSLSLLIMGLTN